MRRTAILLSTLLTLSACADLQNTNYDYAFISQARSFASGAEFPGQVYLLNLSGDGPALTELNLDLQIDDSLYATQGSATLSSSRVVGASADLVWRGVVQASGSLAFDASIKATNTQVRRITAPQAARLLSDAYREAVSGQESASDLPLYARQVIDNPDIYYAFVTGYMETDALVLQHGTAEDSDSGVTIAINGIEFSNVNVGNRNVYSCVKSGAERAVCAISIELLDARLVDVGGETLFRAFPAPFAPEAIAQAFRSRG
jgi:hypothetical protein